MLLDLLREGIIAAHVVGVFDLEAEKKRYLPFPNSRLHLGDHSIVELFVQLLQLHKLASVEELR